MNSEKKSYKTDCIHHAGYLFDSLTSDLPSIISTNITMYVKEEENIIQVIEKAIAWTPRARLLGGSQIKHREAEGTKKAPTQASEAPRTAPERFFIAPHGAPM